MNGEHRFQSRIMAAELTADAILDFLTERGGRASNSDLLRHFRPVLVLEPPEEKAAAREAFKGFVDSVAYVKTEAGVKYVCLRKRFRASTVTKRKKREDPNTTEAAADKGAEPRTPAASGELNAAQVTAAPHIFAHADRSGDEVRVEQQQVVVSGSADVSSSGETMGNRGSVRKEAGSCTKPRQVSHAADIPEIAVIEASPLPAEGSMFGLPGPAHTGSTGQCAAGVGVTDRRVLFQEALDHRDPVPVPVVQRRSSKGSRRTAVSQQPSDCGEDDWQQPDSCSGDDFTPKGSRKHFLEVMMNSSPQLRRSLVLRDSLHMSSRSDIDSLSLASSNPDVALDPLEHQWMMCASDGEWGGLQGLLATEPGLVLRRDFVTGFTCLHWAAKHGKPELIAAIVEFAKRHHVPMDVDVRSSTGYTPLHVAAMHHHVDVVKLLVGAYEADVEIRDYSGKKACQYLTESAGSDVWDMVGASERSDPDDSGQTRQERRWRFSGVLQSKPLSFLNADQCEALDEGDGGGLGQPLRRKSSLSRMKPRLQKLRWRTSQIVQSVSFTDHEDRDRSTRRSFKSRPKSSLFG